MTFFKHPRIEDHLNGENIYLSNLISLTLLSLQFAQVVFALTPFFTDSEWSSQKTPPKHLKYSTKQSFEMFSK